MYKFPPQDQKISLTTVTSLRLAPSTRFTKVSSISNLLYFLIAFPILFPFPKQMSLVVRVLNHPTKRH